jgi:hypothetical protein
VLANLPAREAGVLRMRFGLVDGTEHTLDEIGLQFNVSGLGSMLTVCWGWGVVWADWAGGSVRVCDLTAKPAGCGYFEVSQQQAAALLGYCMPRDA